MYCRKQVQPPSCFSGRQPRKTENEFSHEVHSRSDEVQPRIGRSATRATDITRVLIGQYILNAFVFMNSGYHQCDWFQHGVQNYQDSVEFTTDWIRNEVKMKFRSYTWLLLQHAFSSPSLFKLAVTRKKTQENSKTIIDQEFHSVHWTIRNLAMAEEGGSNRVEVCNLGGTEIALPLDLIEKVGLTIYWLYMYNVALLWFLWTYVRCRFDEALWRSTTLYISS